MTSLPLRTIALLMMAAALGRADELQLRDGTKVDGRLIFADDREIVFKTASGPVTKSRAEVRTILLGESEGGGVPPGVALGDGLRATRWFTVRRIAPFNPEEGDSISGHKLSEDGSKIIFSCGKGVFTVNPDGTGLTQILDKDVEGYVAITGDGKRVFWFEGRCALFTALADGSGKRKVGDTPYALWFRMTTKGDRFVIGTHEKKGGLYDQRTDGSESRRIVSAEDIARLGGFEASEGLWWSSFAGMSADGSRIVFTLGSDAFAVNLDGSGLRRLTSIDKTRDKIGRIRISGNGARIAIYYDNSDLNTKSRLEFRDWESGGTTGMITSGPFPRQGLFQGISLSISSDGRQAALGAPLALHRTDGKNSWIAGDESLRGEDLAPLYGFHIASFSDDFRRASVDLAIGRAQLVVIDFNPATLNGAPALGSLSVVPRDLPVDGSKIAVSSARVPDAGWRYVGVAAYRNGERIKAFYWDHLRLKEAEPAGSYISEKVQLEPSYNVEPGPLGLRFFAFNKAAHALIVDVEGVEARKP